MRLEAAQALVLSAALSLATGCGDDARFDGGAAEAGVEDAGTPPTPIDRDSGEGSPTPTPEAGTVDAGSFPEFFTELSSNLPEIRVVQESESGLLQVRLMSSNLEPLSAGGLRWFGELRNGSRESWCNPEVVVRFFDDQEAMLWEGEAEVRAALHHPASVAGDGEPLPCVATEDTTVAWAVDLEAPAIDLNDVDAIGLRIGGDALPQTMLHAATPQLETSEIIELDDDAGASHAVAGALRGMMQPVSYAAVEVYVKSEQGFIFEVFHVAKADPADGTLEPDELWQFQTAPSADPIASFRALISFEL